MHILILKTGALGDVVRTSYFCAPLREKFGVNTRISWYTAPEAIPLLRFNPLIDDIWSAPNQLQGCHFDRVFSLDDELAVAELASTTDHRTITGVYIDATGQRTYSEDSSVWFDMGLLSKFGKEKADKLKRMNQRGHAEIFSTIFQTEFPRPRFFGNPLYDEGVNARRRNSAVRVGINAFAGKRWPAKALKPSELSMLLPKLNDIARSLKVEMDIFLYGMGDDYLSNKSLAMAQNTTEGNVSAIDTSDSPLFLSAHVKSLDLLISSDSLALHLAIGQQVPFVAFFAPTSAAEIDSFGLGEKILSLTNDYCSYRPDADNSTLTAERLSRSAHVILERLTAENGLKARHLPQTHNLKA